MSTRKRLLSRQLMCQCGISLWPRQTADGFCDLLSWDILNPHCCLSGGNIPWQGCPVAVMIMYVLYLLVRLIKYEMYILQMVVIIGLFCIFLLSTYIVPDATEHWWWVTDCPLAGVFWSVIGWIPLSMRILIKWIRLWPKENINKGL